MSQSTQEFLNQYLDRYEIEARIGSGGMARVYRGHDKSLNRTVAIKVLYEHLSQEASFRERFEREAQLVAQLNHPNIVQVYDFNTIDRGDELIHFMVMSYIAGQTLQSVLDSHWSREETMPYGRVLEVMQNLADALGYAHERGMIHRDVKPANILFDERDQAVLTDFGIARMAQSSALTQEGNTVGTPAYMSPEQATGEVVDSRSDLYGMGIILYEMLTGRPPFADDGSLSVLLKHLNEPVPPLSSRVELDNPSLEMVVFKSLAKLADDRYQTAQEFADDLKRAFDGEPVEAALPAQTRQFTTGPIAAIRKADIQQADTSEVKNATRSPLLLLVGGLLIVTVILVIGLLSNQDSSASASPSGSDDTADSMTGQVYFTGTFDDDDMFIDYWPVGSFNLVTREIIADGFYRIDSDLEDTAVATIFDDATDYTDMSLQMRARLEEGSSPASGYGLIFRYQDDKNYNVFAVDGLGRFSVWVLEDDVWRELRELNTTWTMNDSIYQIGEFNLLSIEIDGDEISAFVNGMWVASLSDMTLGEGEIGIYVASPPGGQSSILVDMFQVSDAPLSLTQSMTGALEASGTPTPPR